MVQRNNEVFVSAVLAMSVKITDTHTSIDRTGPVVTRVQQPSGLATLNCYLYYTLHFRNATHGKYKVRFLIRHEGSPEVVVIDTETVTHPMRHPRQGHHKLIQVAFRPVEPSFCVEVDGIDRAVIPIQVVDTHPA